MQAHIYNISENNKIEPLILRSPQDWEGIFNTITDMITIHDRDFNIIYANKAAKDILGLPHIEINKKIKCFHYYHGTICPLEGCPTCNCVKTGEPAVIELFEHHLSKNIEIRAMPRFNSQNQIIGIIHIVRDITQRKQSEEQLKDSREKLRNLTAHLHFVREEERKHIAREIHDELAQALTALKMDMVSLTKKLPKDRKSIIKNTKSMSNFIDMTICTVRRISSELRPRLLDDLGLQAAIEWQAKDFQNRTGIKCEVLFHSDTSNLDQERSTTIFRIFQEAMTNVARHAMATNIKVSLKENLGNLIMEVRDNGIGITEKQIANPKSFGIIGMQERAHLLGGDIKISRVQGNETSVTASIPLYKSRRKSSDQPLQEKMYKVKANDQNSHS